jgi:hypothetical protein
VSQVDDGSLGVLQLGVEVLVDAEIECNGDHSERSSDGLMGVPQMGDLKGCVGMPWWLPLRRALALVLLREVQWFDGLMVPREGWLQADWWFWCFTGLQCFTAPVL